MVGTKRYNTKLKYEANHNSVELNARPVLKCQHERSLPHSCAGHSAGSAMRRATMVCLSTQGGVKWAERPGESFSSSVNVRRSALTSQSE